MEDKITYEDAYSELLEISNEIENDEVIVSELIEKLKRAGELIKICREQLKLTEEESKKILEQFEKQ
mgnify:FL=1